MARLMKMRMTSRVVIFTKHDKESIYLIYRKKNGEEYYVIPGGGIENGENIEQAARREAIEEIGVTLKDLKLINNNENTYLFTANELFKAEPIGDELKNIDPNNYYEVQIHKVKNLESINLKPKKYKMLIKELVK